MSAEQVKEKPSREYAGDKLMPLLDKRSQLKERLSLLEGKRGEVSQEVFEKVKSDYAGRLDSLNREVERHMDNLQATQRDYRELLDRLEQAVDYGNRSLEELKVRFALGEYTSQEFENIGREKKARVEYYSKKIGKFRVNLNRLDSVISQISAS